MEVKYEADIKILIIDEGDYSKLIDNAKVVLDNVIKEALEEKIGNNDICNIDIYSKFNIK
ncbi:hypothetical protein ACXAT3_002795 [Clostridium sporogenes]|nr:hypothetical protein [Clostridium botulinum]